MSPKDLYTMFIATVFRIDPDWKQPKCSSTAEWINKWWCSYAIECCSSRREERAASLNPSKLEASETELLHSFSNCYTENKSTTNITAKNNIHLLTHNSVGQKSKHKWLASLLGFWAESMCWLDCISLPGGSEEDFLLNSFGLLTESCSLQL